MGTYLNPGNDGFARINNSSYIDKTGLIGLMNERVNGPDNLVCISRPRRFGKSWAAKMLTAYYDASCDSHGLFSDKKIAGFDSYEEHINGYNVIYLDISGFISNVMSSEDGSIADVPDMIKAAVKKDLMESGFEPAADDTLNDFLLRCIDASKGRRFIFIIDEWDAIIREAKDDARVQKSYLNLLRGWFKNENFTSRAVAAAYMTGILPIKKDGSQSAISDFKEYSMLDADEFAPFYGFTEAEVRQICDSNGLIFDDAKQWYDGYTMGSERSMYNPYSVMEAVKKKRVKSFWKKTSAAEALMTYIDMDHDGLQEDVVRLISGQTIEVDVDSFQNDFETFTCKDDVLTLLVHLGYLTYEEHESTGYVTIPNEEIRIEFEKILHRAKHKDLIDLVRRSDELVQDTIMCYGDKVASAIEKIHDSSFAPTFYNDEQALRYTIKIAYISCVDQYARIEELPSGHGLADVVFIPKKRSNRPAMVIELKWDKSAEGALSQIKNRSYSDVPLEITGETIMVGINYDEKTKKHTCEIEKIVIK